MHLRNAVTADMKHWGYGQGYRYPHNEGGHAAGATYLPEALQNRRYYRPKAAGLEIKIRERLERLRHGEENQATADDPASREPDEST